MNSKIITFLCLALSLTALSPLIGQELTLYKVPQLPAGYNFGASMATNSAGDILLMYANGDNGGAGAVYYYKKHDSSTWKGPTPVPNQPYDAVLKSDLTWTDCTSTKDDQFHAIWSFHTHWTEAGMYYAVFNPANETWSAPEKLLNDRIEEPRLITNWMNGDLILGYCAWTAAGMNKDVYLKVKTQAGWQPELNISKYVSQVTAASPSGSSVTNMAPHGDFAETNISIAVDESDGYVYAAWKEDEEVIDPKTHESYWDLRIRVALFNPSYQPVWHEQVTAAGWGWHFLPSITAMDGKAIMAFAWYDEGSYNYLFFTRDGDTLIYDKSEATLIKNRIDSIPTVPHYIFHNHLLTHGDEIVATYNNSSRYKKMKRLKNWAWSDRTGVDLSKNQRGDYPYDSYSDPNIGILTCWQNTDDEPEVVFTIYDYKRPAVRPGRNIKVTSGMDRSHLRKVYYNVVTWEANPVNDNRNITVSAYRIYRRLKSESTAQYEKVGEVDGSTLKFYDFKNITTSAPDAYAYFVTGVDDQGNESAVPTI